MFYLAPSTDNDGNALLTGALYWNSSSNGMYAWTGSAWVLATNYNDAAVDTHLNTGTAASGEFLSWNGSDYDWAAAGADLYAANPSSATDPSATGNNSVSIGSGANSDGTDAIAIGTGADAGSGVAIGKNTETSALAATAIGSNLAGTGALGSGFGAMAFGASRANGTESLAAVISNNTSSYGATGANSIAIGDRAKATAANSVAIGGYGSVASSASAIAFGYQAESTDQYSTALGYGSKADARYAVALGQADTHGVRYRHAYGGDRFSSTGDAQAGLFILLSDTTDATAEAMTTDNGTASTFNQLILPNNSAYSVSGTIIARESAAAGSDYASWEIKGALLRDANAASTVLGNGIQNKLYATSGASAWAIALSADTTNGGLKIEVTGAASTNIRWVATVNTSEVTYA